jgi:hypothetical protein
LSKFKYWLSTHNGGQLISAHCRQAPTDEFTGLVLTASLVVCPLIYLAMNHRLDQFAYRQDPGLFVFFASGIAVLLVTWLTGGRSGAANRVA